MQHSHPGTGKIHVVEEQLRYAHPFSRTAFLAAYARDTKVLELTRTAEGAFDFLRTSGFVDLVEVGCLGLFLRSDSGL
jgi:hypothetical protein